MTTVPVHVVAAVDQQRAALRDLARLAREHQLRGCDLPPACAGTEVANLLDELTARGAGTLVFTAIAELARLGYGEAQDEPP